MSFKEMQHTLEELALKLNSPNVNRRHSSANGLAKVDETLDYNVTQALEVALKEKRDMKLYDGSFNLICDVIRVARIENTTGPLMDYIDFALDPRSFPVGANFPPNLYYPAATALVEARSPRLNRYLLDLFTSEISEKKLQVAAWMLQEANGNEVAQFIVEREMADYDSKLKNLGLTTDIRKSNLLKVLELLKAKDGVILPPVEEEKTDERRVPNPTN